MSPIFGWTGFDVSLNLVVQQRLVAIESKPFAMVKRRPPSKGPRLMELERLVQKAGT